MDELTYPNSTAGVFPPFSLLEMVTLPTCSNSSFFNQRQKAVTSSSGSEGMEDSGDLILSPKSFEISS
jgi:hypothetical protein